MGAVIDNKTAVIPSASRGIPLRYHKGFIPESLDYSLGITDSR